MSFNEMTNEELDAVLAETIKELIDDDDRIILQVDDHGTVVVGAEMALADTPTFWLKWSPSTNIADFDDVKREIERRGWSWWSSYNSSTKRYYFGIGVASGDPARSVAETLERAGCIAFLKATMRDERDDL